MGKKILNLLFFLVLAFCYLFPVYLFKPEVEFYNSLAKPFYAMDILYINYVWVILYLCLALFLVIFFTKKIYKKKHLVLLLLNFLFMFFFPAVLFQNKELYFAFVFMFFGFLTMFFIYFDILKENRKLSTLLVPYLLFTAYYTTLLAHIYLIN